MKVECVECHIIHEIGGWLDFGNYLEVHLTCTCGNKLTLEGKKSTEGLTVEHILGCQPLLGFPLEATISHSIEDIQKQFFSGLRYEFWGNNHLDEDAY